MFADGAASLGRSPGPGPGRNLNGLKGSTGSPSPGPCFRVELGCAAGGGPGLAAQAECCSAAAGPGLRAEPPLASADAASV